MQWLSQNGFFKIEASDVLSMIDDQAIFQIYQAQYVQLEVVREKTLRLPASKAGRELLKDRWVSDILVNDHAMLGVTKVHPALWVYVHNPSVRKSMIGCIRAQVWYLCAHAVGAMCMLKPCGSILEHFYRADQQKVIDTLFQVDASVVTTTCRVGVGKASS